MSLESGRKLGLAASIITIVLPIIAAIAYAVYFFSLFATIDGGTNLTGPMLTIPTLIIIVFGAIGISVLGIILLLVGMHRLSQYYNEPGIFKGILYGFIINIVGAVIILGGFFALIISSVHTTLTSGVTPIQTTSNYAGQIVFGFLFLAIAELLWR